MPYTEILVNPSSTADTRTCDWSKVTKETLLASSVQHIGDVAKALHFFVECLEVAAIRHDHDKLSAIDHFHADFQTGFKQTMWWDNHRKVNRHHIDKPDGVPAGVTLIDVLEHVADCVMAGMARSGKVTALKLPPEVLEAAFQNTAVLLQSVVSVVTPTARGEGGFGSTGR